MLRSALLTAALLSSATAQPTIDQVLDSLGNVHKMREVSLSPNGHKLAWVQDGDWASLNPKTPPKRISACSSKCAESGPSWSPDGRSIAVLFTGNAARSLGPLEPIVPEAGPIDEKIFVRRIALVDAASGATRQISPDKLYVYEFDWSHDSERLVYSAAAPPGDDNWYVAQLYTIDAASDTVQQLLKPAMQMANPRWSPDGKTIAFIGGLMSDEGPTGGDIYTIAAAGGTAHNITPSRKSSPSWIGWLPSSDGFLMLDHAMGTTALATIDFNGLSKTLWSGEETVEFSGNSADTAVVRSSFSQPHKVWAGATGGWEQVTHANADQKPMWGEEKSLVWKSDPWPNTFFGRTALASQGYFLFYPNFRGSYGQGEAFTRANVKDFGYGDLRDILSGLDKIVREYGVDEKRAGLSNWTSYYCENSIDQWLIPFFGAAVYDSPAVYDKSSPIRFIKNVKTPTLVLVGERDGEVPPPLSREFRHALKALDVKTEMVVYAGDGHMFHDKEHIRDLMPRTVQRFNQEMK